MVWGGAGKTAEQPSTLWHQPMPELPEVQTIVDDLNALGLPGRRITTIRVRWPRTIAHMTPAQFSSKVRGRTIRAIDRRGKFIRFHLDQGWCMAVHLRMTGKFALEHEQVVHGKHDHVILGLGRHGFLRFQDTRKFGRFYLVSEDLGFFDRFGPEPLDRALTAQRFSAMLQGCSRLIKPLLLDQTFIAGLGNIYVDEALWRARIHPRNKSDALDRQQAGDLLKAIRRVLRQGLKHAGTTLSQGQGGYRSMRRGRGDNKNRLKVFRRTGRPCPRCGGAIERIVVGQRSTHVCISCQPVQPRQSEQGT